MRLLVTAVALLLILAACGDGSWTGTGTVIDKRHEAERTWVSIIPITTTNCTSTGKYTSCSPITTYIPFIFTDDEDWIVRIRKEDGDEQDVWVHEDVYESVAVGDLLDCDDGDCSINDPDEKRRQ